MQLTSAQVKLAALQAMQQEKINGLAAIILEDVYAYSSFFSASVIADANKPIPPRLPDSENKAWHLKQKHARRALNAAQRSFQFLTGNIG